VIFSARVPSNDSYLLTSSSVHYSSVQYNTVQYTALRYCSIVYHERHAAAAGGLPALLGCLLAPVVYSMRVLMDCSRELAETSRQGRRLAAAQHAAGSRL